MRVLFDIVHPAHVHFYRHMAARLRAAGHETLLVARDKDVTRALLDALGLPHVALGRAGGKNWLGQGWELLTRDLALWRLARRFRADVICARNPAGMHAARLAGAVGIYDSDDGPAAGIQWRLGAQAAHVITTPAVMRGAFGPKHRPYPGYKQSAYLHPASFTPDPAIPGALGVAPGEPFFLLRFVAMTATHDHGKSGMAEADKAALIDRLQARGRVFISSEGPLPERWSHLQLPLPPHRMHDVLACATLVVGDSQTMAAEAAFLGTPNLRLSAFTGRLDYLEELEHRYGLTRSFHLTEGAALLAAVENILSMDDPRGALAPRRAQLLAETGDLVPWYVDLIQRAGAAGGAPP